MDLSNYQIQGDILMSFFWAAIPAITAGISAVSGLFGKKSKSQQQTGGTIDQTQTQTQDQTSTSTPTYDPYSAMLKNLILGKLTNRVNADEGETVRSYITNQIKEINSGAALKNQALRSTLAARGLSTSPMAAIAENAAESARQGAIVNASAQAPLLQRQLQRESMNDLSSFFSSLPVGQTNTVKGTTTNVTKGTTTGNYTGSTGGGVGGLLENLGQGLASTYGLQYWLKKLLEQSNNKPTSVLDASTQASDYQTGG